MSVDRLFADGVKFHQSGDLARAERNYNQVLELVPSHPGSMHYLGLIAFQRGQFTDAVSLIGNAIRQAEALPEPVPAEFYVNFANALKRCGELGAALAAYHQALRLRPGQPTFWYNYALLQRQMGDLQGAINSLECASRKPAFPPTALVELGECYALVGKDTQSVLCFERVLQFLQGTPVTEEALDLRTRIGTTLVRLARYDVAIRILAAIRKIRPAHTETLNVLGCAYAGSGELTKAKRCLEEAYLQAPADVQLIDNLACAYKDSGQVIKAVELYAPIIGRADIDFDVRCNYLFCLLYSDKFSPREIAAKHLSRRSGPCDSGHLTHVRPVGRLSAKRIRIGLLSGDMRNHPVAYFISGVLEELRSRSVELFVFANNMVSDAWTTRLRAAVLNWRAVQGLTDDELAEHIRMDEIDVLIDLAGHSAGNRLAALKSRPAPVQVSYLGYPFTTGLPWINWRIVDWTTDPAGSDELSSESLYRLGRSYYGYTAPLDAPPVSTLPASKTGFITFGVSSNLAKVTATTLDIWAQILKRFQSSRLYWRARAFADERIVSDMTAELTRRGVAANRLTLAAWAPHTQRWREFEKIDIALDTYPYNQATNTCEALWMGVPTLSVSGHSHQARMGASILQSAGLPEWVIGIDQFLTKPDAALSRCVALFEITGLAALRNDMRPRLIHSQLMDCADLAKAIERACRAMLADACNDK